MAFKKAFPTEADAFISGCKNFPAEAQFDPSSATNVLMGNKTLQMWRNSCMHCKKEKTATNPIQLKSCANCLVARYCGPDCQRADWKQHKGQCALLKVMGKQITAESIGKA